MNLDSKSWIRLIHGLISFTNDGRLKWQVKQDVDDFELHSYIGGKKTLVGSNGKHLYVLTGMSFGRAPFEFTVSEVTGSSLETIAYFKSGEGLTTSPANVNVTNSLNDLFRTAEASIPNPGEIVNSLMKEFNND